MEFSVLLADLRDVAEKYKGKTTEPQVSTNAYVDMFTKILERAEKSTEKYDDKITVLWVALNQLASIYKDLSAGSARDQLCKFIFGLCAKTVLNIQWSQLDEDSQVKCNFSTTVENVHEILSQLGFHRFQLILDLMESHWTHPILSKIMSGDADDDDEDSDEYLEYIQKEDPDILKLRIEIMINENCEEFALNLCNWSLKHPALTNNLKIKEHQIYILYRQQEYAKMQEVCETIVCHEGIEVMSHLRQKEGNDELCIRLAQVFLIQDWVKPERTCCTQELLQLWIHHQYLADKDRERFLDSIWTVAKVCRDTEQIGVLIDGVKKECGDMFIQLYTELCKYAINIDKGNMEREEVQSDKEEFSRRKLAMSKTCVRMAFMLMEHDFRMSRICGLTAFALDPTMDNLNLVNKLYWTHKNVSAASKNSKIDIATLYEIERLLGQMRPETLNPDYSWKQLIPLCKKYKSNHESIKYKMTTGKPCVSAIKPEVQAPVISTFQVPSTGKVQNSAGNKITKVQMTTKDIEKAHLTKLLSQKNIPPEQIEQILSRHFPRNTSKDEAPQLNMKQLDKTINDLKKSIYLETEYRESMMQNLSSLHRSKVGKPNQSSGQSQHVSRIDQFKQTQPNSQKNPCVQRQQSAPGISNSQGSNILQRQLSVGAQRPPTAHSHHRPQQFSPVGFGGSPPPAHSSINRQQELRIGSPSELGNGKKQIVMRSSASSETVSEQLSKKLKEISQRQQQQGKACVGNIPFNILRPPGNDKQECAKIAQQIAELREKQRAERERMEKQRADAERLDNIRMQGHLDGVKAVLNSRNIASKSQISNLLSLTLQGSKSPENKPGILNIDVPRKSYQRKKNNYSPSASINSTISSSKSLQQANISSPPGTNVHVNSATVRPKPPNKRAQPAILRQGEKTWDPKHGVMKQKYYLSSDAIKSPEANQVINPSSTDPNRVMKPVYSMVVPKSLTAPDRTEDFVNAVTNIIKQFPSGGETLHRVQNPGQNIQLFTCQNLNTSIPQNETNIGTIGTQLGVNQSANNSTLTVVSQNGVCIPVTGQNISNIQDSNNGLLNLNTLANASMTVLGQATSQPTQFQVSLQPAQQLFSPIVEPQQTFTTIQTGQPIQQVQPNCVYSTPLYTVAQPFTVDNNVNLQSPVNINNTVTLPVDSLQNPLVTLDSSQCSMNVVNHSQQQVASQLTSQNTVSYTDNNNASTVQPVKEKPVLATPELSPALVQQILSTIKKKHPQDSQSPKIVDSAKLGETNASSTAVANNKNDNAINKGVIEAQKNILHLREQYEKAANAAAAAFKCTEPLKTVKSSASTNQLIGLPRVLNMNDVNSKLEAVPELPDLGAKEFHIDDLLALDDGNTKLSNQSAINSTSSNVTSVSGTTGGNPLVPAAGSENKPDRAQSTYMNANRLAKEREIREAQVQDTNRLNKTSPNTSQVKKCGGCGVSFPSRKLLCEHKKITKCNKQYKCSYCQMIFKNLELLKSHEKNFCLKAPVGIVKCHICGVYFESHEQLKGHLILQKCFPQGTNHNGHVNDLTRIICGICDRRFENMQAIKDHVKTGCIKKTTGVNNEYQLKDYEYVAIFRCTGCKLMNTSEQIVTLHVEKCKTRHTTAEIVKLFKCCMCNDVFTQCDNLVRHVSKQCPKLRATTNQRQVQDSYQKLKNANMLQTSSDQQVKTPAVDNVSTVARQEIEHGNEISSETVQNPSVSSTNDNKLELKDIDAKSNVSISTIDKSVDLSIKSESNISAEVEADSKPNVTKSTGDEILDENMIKLQKERRISAEKQFLAEFEKIERKKREIRMEKLKERAQMMEKQENERVIKDNMDEMTEQQRKEKLEREKIETEKKRFMEKILGKVSLQEKMKVEVSLQNKALQEEVRKVLNENKQDKKKMNEVESNVDNKEDESEKRKTVHIKQVSIVKPKGSTAKTYPVSVSKKRRKPDDDNDDDNDVIVKSGTNKAAKKTNENKNTSLKQVSSTSRTRKKLSPQDIRKLKGLREKHLIKQKKYYMDEMFPAFAHRTKSVDSDRRVPHNDTPRSLRRLSQNDPPKSQRKMRQSYGESPDELTDHERVYLNECRFCDIRNKQHFGKRFYLAIHYVRGHQIGYNTSKYYYHCKFCGMKFPTSQTKAMKEHVFMSHPVSVIKNVAAGKYDFMVRESGGSSKHPLFTKRYFSPKKNDKIKKHMRAVALRQKCAEKLKQLAMHTEDSDHEYTDEEVDTVDEVASPRETTDNTVSKSGNRIAPRLSRNLVNKSNSVRTRRQALSSEKDSDSSSRLRSRSSSVSSNRSSIIVSARKRKIAMATARRNSSPGSQKGLTTRSGLALRSTESSGLEDDTSGTEDGCIKKRKSARIRKLSDRDKSLVDNEPSETEDSLSDDVKPRATRHSSRTQVDNNTPDSRITSRSTRSGRTTDRLKGSSGKTSGSKENKFSSLRSHTKSRRYSREESIVTRQSSKNEEESDSVTESSSSDTESTIHVSNIKERRRRGVRSAESDSESTSHGDRHKRYKFRRRVSKTLYQESQSSGDDHNDDDDGYSEESDLEISGECEKFRSSDVRNSCDDESSTSYQYIGKFNSIEKSMGKPRTVMLGPDDDDDHDFTPLSSQDDLLSPNLDEDSCDNNAKLVKTKSVVIAPENDDEFAGLETEPVVLSKPMVVVPDDDEFAGLEHEPVYKSSLTAVAPENDEEFAGLDIEPMVEAGIGKEKVAKQESNHRAYNKAVDSNNDYDVAQTMDKMLDLIPSLSADNLTSSVNKNHDKVVPKIDNCNTEDDSTAKEYLNAYQDFVTQLTPAAKEPDLNKSRRIINEEYLKSVKVVITDIASTYGKLKSKVTLPNEKLIEECHKQKCVVNIRRLSQEDLDQLQTRNRKTNKISEKTNEQWITIETDEDSDDTIQNETTYIPGNDRLSQDRDVNQESDDVQHQQDEFISNVTEVVIQDADITFCMDQMINESNKLNVISSNIIHIDTDNIEGNVDAKDIDYVGDIANTYDAKPEKFIEEGFSLVDKSYGDDNEDVWIENAETYAEPIDASPSCNTSSVMIKPEAIVGMEKQIEVEIGGSAQQVSHIENEIQTGENEQRIIIDPASHNVVCTIGNDEHVEGTVLEIQVDNDTDIVQLVVENVPDETNTNIVVNVPESNPLTTCNEVSSYTAENAAESFDKSNSVAGVNNSVIQDPGESLQSNTYVAEDDTCAVENASKSLLGNTNSAETDNTSVKDIADDMLLVTKACDLRKTDSNEGVNEEQSDQYVNELKTATNEKLSIENKSEVQVSLEHCLDNHDSGNFENDNLRLKSVVPELNTESVDTPPELNLDHPDTDGVTANDEVMSVKSVSSELNSDKEVRDISIGEESKKELVTKSKDVEESENVDQNDDCLSERLTTNDTESGSKLEVDSQNKTNDVELNNPEEILRSNKTLSEEICQDKEMVSQVLEDMVNDINDENVLTLSMTSSVSLHSQHSVESESDIESIDLDIQNDESKADGEDENVEPDTANTINGNNPCEEKEEIVPEVPAESINIEIAVGNADTSSNSSDLVKSSNLDNSISEHSQNAVESEVENVKEFEEPVITVLDNEEIPTNNKIIKSVENTADECAILEDIQSSKESVNVLNELDNKYNNPLDPMNKDNFKDVVNNDNEALTASTSEAIDVKTDPANDMCTETYTSVEEECLSSVTDNIIEKINCNDGNDAISDEQNEINELFEEEMSEEPNIIPSCIANEKTEHSLEIASKSAETTDNVSCEDFNIKTSTDEQGNAIGTDLNVEIDNESINSDPEKVDMTSDTNLISEDVLTVDPLDDTVYDKDDKDKDQTSLDDIKVSVKLISVANQDKGILKEQSSDEFECVQEIIEVNNKNDHEINDNNSDPCDNTNPIIKEVDHEPTVTEISSEISTVDISTVELGEAEPNNHSSGKELPSQNCDTETVAAEENVKIPAGDKENAHLPEIVEHSVTKSIDDVEIIDVDQNINEDLNEDKEMGESCVEDIAETDIPCEHTKPKCDIPTDNDVVDNTTSTCTPVDSNENDNREIELSVEVVPPIKLDTLQTDSSSKPLDNIVATTFTSVSGETFISSCSEAETTVNTSHIKAENIDNFGASTLEGTETGEDKPCQNESCINTTTEMNEDASIKSSSNITNEADEELRKEVIEAKTTNTVEDSNNVSSDIMIQRNSGSTCSLEPISKMPIDVFEKFVSAVNKEEIYGDSDSSELSLISYDSIETVKVDNTLIEIHDERENPLETSSTVQSIVQLNDSHDTTLKQPESLPVHDDISNENNDTDIVVNTQHEKLGQYKTAEEHIIRESDEAMKTAEEHFISESDEASTLSCQNTVEVKECNKESEVSEQENTASCSLASDEHLRNLIAGNILCDVDTSPTDNTTTAINSNQLGNIETSPILEHTENEPPMISVDKTIKDIPTSDTLNKSKKRKSVVNKSKGKSTTMKTLAVKMMSDVSLASISASSSSACQTEKLDEKLSGTAGAKVKDNKGDSSSDVITTSTKGTKLMENKSDRDVVSGKRVRVETEDGKGNIQSKVCAMTSTEIIPVKSESSGKRSTLRKTITKKEKSNEPKTCLTGQNTGVDNASTATVSNKRNYPICHQMEDETDEDFRRRTENVRQARKKSASKSYESDFNFEESGTKPTETDSKLTNATFWQSDSEVSFDAVSFHSSSSGTSGGQSSTKDGTSKLHKRLARDFGQDVNTSPPAGSTTGEISIVVSPCKPQRKIDMTSLGERISPGSVFKKLPYKILQTEVPGSDNDLKSDQKADSDSSGSSARGSVKALRTAHSAEGQGHSFSSDETSQSLKRRNSVVDSTTSTTRTMLSVSGAHKTIPCKNREEVSSSSHTLIEPRSLRPKKVKESSSTVVGACSGEEEQSSKEKQKPQEELALDKVKKLRALHNNGKPFKWENTSSPPKKRKLEVVQTKTDDKDFVKKDNKNNTRSSPSKCKTIPAGTSSDQIESRTPRDKKGKDSTSDKDASIKTEIIKSEKLDEVTRKPRKSTDIKSPEHTPVRTRSRSGTSERSVNVPGNVADNDTVSNKQSTKVTTTKPVIHIVHLKKEDVGSRQLRKRDTTGCKTRSGDKGNVDDNSSRRHSTGKTGKRCKLDGTSSSPEIEKQIDIEHKRSGSIERARPTRRQVIHAGKVFEFQDGRVLETDIQDFSSTERNEPPKSTDKVIPVYPEIKRTSRRISDQVERKRALSPEPVVYKNNTTTPSTNINKYIKETLEGIKKMRNHSSSPWKFHKPARSGTRNRKTFPYEFKKS